MSRLQTEHEPPDTDQEAEVSVDAGELRSIDRLLAALGKDPDDPFVLPKREPETPSGGALQSWAMQPLPNNPADEPRGGFLAWLFLSLGVMAFACGGVMLIWSVTESREELWSLGIPLALGGQGAIIFGLIGLVEAAAQRQKQFTAALEEHRLRLVLMQNFALAGQTAAPARRAA